MLILKELSKSRAILFLLLSSKGMDIFGEIKRRRQQTKMPILIKVRRCLNCEVRLK